MNLFFYDGPISQALAYAGCTDHIPAVPGQNQKTTG